MADSRTDSLCATCNNRGTLICSSCKSMHYCSKACQKSDWSNHKLICKTYKDFLPTQPDLHHHSAIYFHPDEPHPRFIWLPFQAGHHHPSLTDLSQLGIDAKNSCTEQVAYNPVLQRHIEPHHITIFLPEAEKLCPCCSPDLKPNQSLAPIDPELAEFFRAPVLALGHFCEADLRMSDADLDLGPRAFRHVVDALRKIYCQYEEEIRLACEPKSVAAVRLNCEADKYFFDRTTVEAVFEPASSLLIDSQIPTPVADKIGLPLIVRKVPPAILWRDPRRPCRTKNHKAYMLDPPHQSEDTGSVVLIRKDGKPLHPMHVYALFGYTALKLKHSDHPENECLFAEDLHAERIDQVSKEDFERWYLTMSQKYSHGAEFVPSPFDD